MSLTEPEVRRLLAIVMAYDNRKPGDATVMVWGEAARRGRWTLTEAEDAIHEHFANSASWLMPGTITERIRAVRNERALNEPIVRPDPIGQARLAELTSGAFRAIGGDEPAAKERRSALAKPCPYCEALAGQPCTRKGASGRVQLAAVHPSRLDGPAEGRPA